jgi:hypothetical protein
MSWERHPDPKAWAKRFDELVEGESYPKTRMHRWLGLGNEWQVFDPESGYFYRRNAKGCCGCGQNRNTEGPMSIEAIQEARRPKGLVNWFLGRT